MSKTNVTYIKENPNHKPLGVLGRGDKFVRVCEPGVYIRLMHLGSNLNGLSVGEPGCCDTDKIFCVSMRSGCCVALHETEKVIPVNIDMTVNIPN